MNHLLQAVQLYVFGRRASFDFHDAALVNGAPFGNDDVVVLGNSDGLVVTWLPSFRNDFGISDGNWVCDVCVK